MSDGVLDGQGASGADSRVSATMLVTSAQVLVEAIRNTLDVNNAPATDMLDVAIGIAAPGSSQKTADLPVTEELLQSTRTALDAAMLVSDNTGLAHTQAALDTVVSGDASMMAASMVPALASNDMDDAIDELIASPANQNKALKGRPDFEAPDGNESSDETSEATKLAVISAHASSHDEARGRVPGNAIDDNLNSRWTVLQHAAVDRARSLARRNRSVRPGSCCSVRIMAGTSAMSSRHRWTMPTGPRRPTVPKWRPPRNGQRQASPPSMAAMSASAWSRARPPTMPMSMRSRSSESSSPFPRRNRCARGHSR